MNPFTLPSFRLAFRCAIIAAGSILAHANLAAQVTAGLVGTRYVEANFFVEDIRANGIDNGFGVIVRGNLPVSSFLDLSAFASRESIDTSSFDETQLGAQLTAHWVVAEMKPFVDVGLANVWQSSEVGSVRFSDNNALYSLGLGLEAPFSDTTALLLRIGQNRYFDGDLGHYTLYTVGFNHRLQDNLSLTGNVTFRDDDSIYYSLGLALKF